MPSPRFFDFHIHTQASDGNHSVERVLHLAAEAGLEGISITDHDTVDAYAEARAPGLPWILPGVELSTRLDGGEAHILGYFPCGITPEISAYVERILVRRRERMADGIVKLREKGIDIAWDECARLATGRVLLRSHLAEALAAKRYVGRAHRAYERLLGPDVVPLPDEEAAGAVREIGRLGGISVWAHPSRASVEKHLGVLRSAGLAGVEVFIPRRTPSERRDLAGKVRAAGLLVTGGSDWHGRAAGPGLRQFRGGGGGVGELLRRIGR